MVRAKPQNAGPSNRAEAALAAQSYSRFQPAAQRRRPSKRGATVVGISVSVIANFVIIVGLVVYGFALFAEYQARGRWAKNVTGLLAGMGMLALALALLLTPQNVAVLMRIAQTQAAEVFTWMSTALLLAAIAAFGAITYSRPLRLWHERKIERDLNRELPKIP